VGNQERQSHHHQRRVDPLQQKEKGCEAYHIGALKVCVEASFLVSRINDKDVLLLFRLAKNLFLKPERNRCAGEGEIKEMGWEGGKVCGFQTIFWVAKSLESYSNSSSRIESDLIKSM